jgi:hypothetical protein
MKLEDKLSDLEKDIQHLMRNERVREQIEQIQNSRNDLKQKIVKELDRSKETILSILESYHGK